MARTGIGDHMRNFGFIISLLLSICCASIHPSLGAVDGPLNPDVSAKLVATWILFFASSLTITSKEFKRSFTHHQLNCFIQVTSLVAMPAVVELCIVVLEYFAYTNKWLMKGFVVLASLPPPVASTLVLTRYCGGNAAAALFNALLGNVLAIVVTPVNLFLVLGSTTVLPAHQTISSLSLPHIIVPTLLSQLLLKVIGSTTLGQRLVTVDTVAYRTVDVVTQAALVYIGYIDFCRLFQEADSELHAVTLLTAMLLVLVFQIGTMLLVAHAANHLAWFSRQDVVTIVFCSTHKSIALGIPMLRVLYSGWVHFSTISLALLMNQPTQMMIGSLASVPLKPWLSRQPVAATRLPA